MKKLIAVIALVLTVGGCSRGDALEIPTGTDVTVEKNDGVSVSGKLVEVRPEHVVVENLSGERTNVQRADIRTIAAAPAPARSAEAAPAADKPATVVEGATAARDEPRNPVAPIVERRPEYREVTIPAGTVLPVALQSAVGSDTSSPEDAVRGTLRRAVSLDGVQLLSAGTPVLGHVTSATRSAKVKGRAAVAFRFNQIDLPGDLGGRTALSSGTITHVAPATKKEDAAKIGGGAAGGAIIGAIIGGGDGAAKGAAIGGAAGTGVVLSTRGKEARLGPGAAVSVRLTAPLVVRVRME